MRYLMELGFGELFKKDISLQEILNVRYDVRYRRKSNRDYR